jgi:hypothetical protein
MPRRIVRHHRPLRRIAQGRRPRRRALDGDRDFDPLERPPAVAVAVALRIVRVQLQDEQILLVDMEIGAAEGEMVGMALHNPGQAGGAAADHVEARRGQMGDVARIEAADAEMRIVGQDRPPGRGSAGADRPGVAAGIGARLHGRRGGVGRDQRAEREPAEAQHAEVRFGHGGGVQPVRHGQRPGRMQRRDDRVQREQAHRREPGAAHLVADAAEPLAAGEHQLTHVPLQRADAEDAIFERQQAGIGLDLVDAGVDPRDIGPGAGEDVRRHAGQLRVQVAAEQEQPGGGVMLGEGGAEGLRQPAELAPVRQVDLEQPVPRDDIALAEEGVGDRAGADVGHAIGIVDDLDIGRQAGRGHLARARHRRRRAEPGGRQERQRRGRAEQE